MKLVAKKEARHTSRPGPRTIIPIQSCLKLTLSTIFVAFLNACSGGGSTTPALAPSTTPNTTQAALPQPTALPVPGTLSYDFQTTTTTSQSLSRRRFLQGASYGGYTSTAAPISISLNVTPVGGATSNYTGSCTANAAGTSGTCTVSFTALPGPTTFAGTLTESTHTIARFSQISIVKAASANTMSFTANPVVNSVTLQLAASSVNAGTPSNTLLLVNALDANGKTIAGSTPYIDSAGKQVAILLNPVSNAQAGGKGTVTLQGALRITAPGQAAIYAHYDGNWLKSSTISATTTSTAVTTTGATATLTTIPYATEYAVGVNPFGITSGPDGNLWFTESTNALYPYGKPGVIGKITTTGNYTSYSCAPCWNPVFITTGPDQNLWFTEGQNGNYLDKITTSGTASRVISLSGRFGYQIRSGPDGNIWFSRDGNALGKVATNGENLQYYTSSNGIRGIGFAPDGSLWYTSVSTTIGHISQNGTSLGTVTVPAFSNDSGVVAGPDGNIWFTNATANQLYKITPTGGLTTIALQVGAYPTDIIVGPDKNVWFTERLSNTIGYIVPSSTTPVEFTTTNGISANSQPQGITLGPDGNIWFTECNNSKVAKFVL